MPDWTKEDKGTISWDEEKKRGGGWFQNGWFVEGWFRDTGTPSFIEEDKGTINWNEEDKDL